MLLKFSHNLVFTHVSQTFSDSYASIFPFFSAVANFLLIYLKLVSCLGLIYGM